MHEIKIPKELRVGGHDYNVRIDSQTDRELQDEGLKGSHSSLLRRIEVDSIVDPQEMSSLFIHEFCHAVNNIYCDNQMCEIEVDGMASGLHQILEELGVRFVK